MSNGIAVSCNKLYTVVFIKRWIARAGTNLSGFPAAIQFIRD